MAAAAGPAESAGFDAFISYSRRDLVFARTLERALKRYRPPRDLSVPQRPLRIFRDQEDFTGTDYARAIRHHVAASARLIVVCSPAARASPYVNEEIRIFAAARGPEAVIPILIAGLPNNEAPAGAEQDRAFPEALVESLAMPLAADYRGGDPARPRVHGGGFDGPWHKLLADLYGVSRSEVEQREKRRRARARRFWIAAGGSVTAALAGLATWALISRDEAIRQGEVAAARLMTAEARTFTGPEPEVAERQALLALESLRMLRENGGEGGEALSVLSDALTRLPRQVHAFPAPEPAAPAPVLAFSGDGLRLFRAAGLRVEVWTLERMRAEASLAVPRPASAMLSSPDGRWLAVTDAEGGAALLDVGGVERGTSAAPTPRRQLAEAGVRCTAFSPDSGFFAALIASANRRPEVVVWRTADGLPRARLLLPPGTDLTADPALPCVALALEPALLATYTSTDGVTAALLWPWSSSGGDDAVATADAAPVPVRRGRPAPPAPAFRTWSNVTGAGFADGRELLLTRDAGNSQGTLLRASYRAGSPAIDEIETQVRQGAPTAIAPRGQYFAARTGQPPDMYVPLLRGTATQLRSSGDGSILAEVAASGRFSADGHDFISAKGRLLRRWDSATGRETLRMMLQQSIANVISAPGGRYLALISEDRSVVVIDAAHPLERVRLAGLLRSSSGFTDAQLSADGSVVAVAEPLTPSASAGDGSSWQSPTRRSRLGDLANGRTLRRFPSAASVVAGPGGTRAAGPFARTGDIFRLPGPAQLLDLGSVGGASLWKAEVADNAAFSADGKLVIFTLGDGRVTARDTGDGRKLWEASLLETQRRDRASPVVASVQISADSRLVLAWIPPPPTTNDGTILDVLDARTGALVRRETVTPNPISVAVDARRLAIGQRGRARVIDLASGQTLQDVAPPGTLDHIGALALLPDGRRLAMVAGSVASMGLGVQSYSEAAVLVWDLDEKRWLARIPAGADSATEYQQTLEEEEKAFLPDLKLSADGRRVAATEYPSRLAYWVTAAARVRRSAVVWDLAGAAPREILRQPDVEVAALSQDGRFVLLNRDGALETWALDRDSLPLAACARLNRRSLTAEEWRVYLGNRPPRETCPFANGTVH